jgi:hypothetical protein
MFDFLDPSQAFSLGIQQQKESIDGPDAVNSVAMSLSDDQDSMHTARSTHAKYNRLLAMKLMEKKKDGMKNFYLYLWIEMKVLICTFDHLKKSVDY